MNRTPQNSQAIKKLGQGHRRRGCIGNILKRAETWEEERSEMIFGQALNHKIDFELLILTFEILYIEQVRWESINFWLNAACRLDEEYHRFEILNFI